MQQPQGEVRRGTAISEVGPEVTSLGKTGSVLVDQSGLLDQADRECRERGGPSARGANDTSQGCHAFNLARYASARARMLEAKERLRRDIKLDKDLRGLAIDNEDPRPL